MTSLVRLRNVVTIKNCNIYWIPFKEIYHVQCFCQQLPQNATQYYVKNYIFAHLRIWILNRYIQYLYIKHLRFREPCKITLKTSNKLKILNSGVVLTQVQTLKNANICVQFSIVRTSNLYFANNNPHLLHEYYYLTIRFYFATLCQKIFIFFLLLYIWSHFTDLFNNIKLATF